MARMVFARNLRMQKEAADSLKTPAPITAPAKPATPSPVDKVNPSGKYGDKPGEMTPAKMNEKYSGLPKMHSGGTVPKTGPYIMKAGEKVLTPEQHGHLKAAMGLAHSVLSHDPDEQDKEPKKVVKEMRIRRSSNGGHIVTHVHTHFEHPDEEHVTGGADHLLNHVMNHMTDPNEGEEEAEAGNAQLPEPKGAAAIEQAVGYKK